MKVGKTISDFIDQYLLAYEGENSKQKKVRYMQIAWLGLQEMHIDVSGVPKSVLVSVDETSSSTAIPCDMIQNPVVEMPWGDVMVPIPRRHNANFSAPTKYGNVTKVTSTEIPDETSPTNLRVTPGMIPYHFRNGEFMGKFFGDTQESHLYHYVNWPVGIIEFSPSVRGWVMLTYLSNAPSGPKDAVIHPFIESAMTAWMDYAKVRSKQHISQSQKEALFQTFIRAKEWAKIRFNSINSADQVDTSRMGLKATPKM